MKIKIFTLFIALFCITHSMNAEWFKYTHNGKYLFYRVLGGDSVAVMQPNEFVEFSGNEYRVDYKGHYDIPAEVYYNGMTYRVVLIESLAFYNSSVSVSLPEGLKKIGNQAFQSSYLTKIDFPQSLEYIGSDAFRNSKLDSVFLSNNNLTFLGSGAFSQCEGLRYAEIGGGIKYIRPKCFRSCPQLGKIVIHKDVKKIGYEAFAYSGHLSKVILNVDSIEHNAFTETPIDTLKLQGVRYIDYSAFCRCGIKDLNLGNKLKYIGTGAFSEADCAQLSINSLDSISAYAFERNTSLKSVIIGESVRGIIDGAFVECSNLKLVDIADNVNYVGYGAFGSCTSLQTVYYRGTMSDWLKIEFSDRMDGRTDGISNPLHFAKEFYVDGKLCTNIIVPEDIKVLKDYAFWNFEGLQSIILSDSLTKIGQYALAACKNLEYVKCGKNLRTLDGAAIWRCYKLKKLECDSSLTYIGKECFEGDSLLNIYYNGTLRQWCRINFDEYAFRWAYHNLYLQDELLSSIHIPQDIPSVPSYGLEFCDNIVDLKISSPSVGVESFMGCRNLKSLYLDENVNYVGKNAFYYSQNLSSCHVGKNVSYIDTDAFNYCESLKKIVNLSALDIVLGDTTNGMIAYYATELRNKENDFTFETIDGKIYLTHYNATDSILVLPFCEDTLYSIQQNLFTNNSSIKAVYFSESVEKIGSGAFANCKNLKRIFLPNSLRQIEGGAFSECPLLEDFDLPYGLESIGNSSFSGCTSLSRIVIPNTVESFGSAIFTRCNLQYVQLGNNFNNIDPSFGSKGIDTLNYIGSLSEWNEMSFSSVVPLNNVKCLIVNGQVVENISCEGVLSSISAYAFAGYTGLKSVDFTGVSQIGKSSFYNCINLSTITWGNDIDSIGEKAFYGCSAIKNIVFPESLEYIGPTAFGDCRGIETLVFNSGLETIEESVFNRCTSLKEVILPDSLIEIKKSAFSQCEGLKKISIPEKVTKIGAYSFQKSGLKQTILGASVKNIYNYAFYNCYDNKEIFNLSKCNLVKGTTSNGHVAYYADTIHTSIEPSIYDTIGDFVFRNDYDTALIIEYLGKDSVITFPTSYRGNYYSIDSHLFYQVTTITSVIIPDSVVEIGSYIFAGCTNLRNVSIGNNIRVIPENAFSRCSLLSISLNGIIQIDAYAFSGNANLKEIIIPSSIESIGNSAFSDCVHLEIVHNYSSLDIKKGDPSNGYVAYYALCVVDSLNQSLPLDTIDGFIFNTESQIPQLIKYVGKNTHVSLPETYRGEDYQLSKRIFYQDTNVVTVIIPEFVDYIPREMFYGCTKLKSVDLGNNVLGIDTAAFAFTDIESFSSPNLLREIKYMAFYSCKSLKSIELCDSVKRIEKHGIYTPRLQKVVSKAITPPTLTNESFLEIPQDVILYTRAASALTYRNDTYWKVFGFPKYYDKCVVTIGECYGQELSQKNKLYNVDTTIVLDAIPNEAHPHYHFVRWSDGVNGNPRNVLVDRDTTIVAYFDIDTININVTFENGRVILGGGIYNYGDDVRLYAIPDKDFHFVQWSDGVKEIYREFKATQDLNISAIFAADTYTVTSYGQNGIVNGSGEYAKNTIAILTAIPADHYRFVSWDDNNTENPREITVTQDTCIVAYFDVKCIPMRFDTTIYKCQNEQLEWRGNIIPTDDVGVNLYYDSLLTVDGCDSIYALTVRVSSSYFMVEFDTICEGIDYTWHDRTYKDSGIFRDTLTSVSNCDSIIELHLNVQPKSQNTDIFMMTCPETPIKFDGKWFINDTIYTGHFISASGCDSTSTLHLQVYPRLVETYIHDTIVLGDSVVINGIRYNHSVEDQLIVLQTSNGCDSLIHFSLTVLEYYTIALSTNNSHYGFVEGAGIYKRDTTITITAIPNKGYQFNQWSDGNTDNPRQVTVTQDSTFTAIFGVKMCSWLVESNDLEMGAVITNFNDAYYQYGTQITVEASPNSGYKFVKWNDGKKFNPYKFSILDDKYLLAIFMEVTEEQDTTTVTPTSSTATFTWPFIVGGFSYSLTIYLDVACTIPFCTITFNQYGQLIGISFGNRAPRRTMEQEDGFTYTVSGLDANTEYYFKMETMDEDNKLINTDEGAFRTTNDATGIENPYNNTVEYRKVMINGQILILRGARTFTLTGQEVR